MNGHPGHASASNRPINGPLHLQRQFGSHRSGATGSHVAVRGRRWTEARMNSNSVLGLICWEMSDMAPFPLRWCSVDRPRLWARRPREYRIDAEENLQLERSCPSRRLMAKMWWTSSCTSPLSYMADNTYPPPLSGLAARSACHRCDCRNMRHGVYVANLLLMCK